MTGRAAGSEEAAAAPQGLASLSGQQRVSKLPERVWLGRLLWPKLLRSKRRSIGQRVTWVAFIVIGLLIALGIHATAVWFLRLCYEVEVIGPLLCRRLLDVVLLVLLSVLLLSNLVTALSSFFLASDLELVVAAPVPPRTFFSARFTEQVVHSSWMVLAFGLPVLLAFARVAGSGPATYVALVATLPPLLIIPAAAGAVVALLLVFSFPAARVRDLVVGMMFIAFIVLYVLARLLEPERFLNPDGFASMVSFIASFSAPSTPLLPSHWATSVVASTFRDATSAPAMQPALMFAALWTAAGSAHVTGSFLFRRLYSAAFSRSQEGRRVARLSRLWARLRGEPLPADGPIRTPARHAARVDLMRAVGRLAPRGVHREFLVKDLKLLLRDASQWSQLVLLLALIFVYLYNFRYFRSISDSGLVGRLAMMIIGMALSGFVTAAVSVRFAFPLLSLEGRMLWLLGSAPVRPRSILWAKVMSTLPPLVVVGEVMAIASARILGASAAMTALSATVAALTAISVGALSIGLGAVLPDYRAESAAKVASSFGGLVCMSASLLVAFVFVGCAIYPAYWIHRGFNPKPHLLVVCAAVAALVAILSVVVPLLLGARKLDQQEPI